MLLSLLGYWDAGQTLVYQLLERNRSVVEDGDHRKHQHLQHLTVMFRNSDRRFPKHHDRGQRQVAVPRLGLVPVSWVIVDTCRLYGTFQARLATGTYSLNLSYFLQDPRGVGCSESLFPSLPISVAVELGKLTQVNVKITTGIY